MKNSVKRMWDAKKLMSNAGSLENPAAWEHALRERKAHDQQPMNQSKITPSTEPRRRSGNCSAESTRGQEELGDVAAAERKHGVDP